MHCYDTTKHRFLKQSTLLPTTLFQVLKSKSCSSLIISLICHYPPSCTLTFTLKTLVNKIKNHLVVTFITFFVAVLHNCISQTFSINNHNSPCQTKKQDQISGLKLIVGCKLRISQIYHKDFLHFPSLNRIVIVLWFIEHGSLKKSSRFFSLIILQL